LELLEKMDVVVNQPKRDENNRDGDGDDGDEGEVVASLVVVVLVSPNRRPSTTITLEELVSSTAIIKSGSRLRRCGGAGRSRRMDDIG
jgi:hypothetical protein